MIKDIKKTTKLTTKFGNPAKNQVMLETEKGIYFKSYNSIIAFENFKENKTYLDKHFYCYSRTTNQYRNQFLNCNSKDVEKRIDNGTYELVNLN